MERSNTPESTGERGLGAARFEPSSTDAALPQYRSTIDSAKDSVTRELRGARDDLQERAADTVNRQKHQIADRLESIVHALGAAQQSLRDDEQAQLAGYVGDVTQQIRRSTGYLRNNDYSGMMRDMEDMARRNSSVFVGSTFVAGLAMGRFLRASEPEEPMAGMEPEERVAGMERALSPRREEP